MDTIVYKIGNNLYVNMTNKCSNNCDFCVRNHMDKYENYSLWLNKEPSSEEVINELKAKYIDENEIVFCGFGEPTYRIDEILDVCKEIKKYGVKTRINTNGQVKLFNKNFDSKRMIGLIDKVNISLNATSASKYQDICQSEYGEKSFSALIDFSKELKEIGVNVVLSIVDIVGEEELIAAKKLSEELEIPLRIRKYIP